MSLWRWYSKQWWRNPCVCLRRGLMSRSERSSGRSGSQRESLLAIPLLVITFKPKPVRVWFIRGRAAGTPWLIRFTLAHYHHSQLGWTELARFSLSEAPLVLPTDLHLFLLTHNGTPKTPGVAAHHFYVQGKATCCSQYCDHYHHLMDLCSGLPQ